MKHITGSKGARHARRRGAALLYALVAAIWVAGLCLALLGMNISTGRANGQIKTAQSAFYAAEAGLSDAYMQLDEGLLEPTVDQPAFVGSADAPVVLGPVGYWVEVAQLDSRSYSIVSTGAAGQYRERLELVLAEAPNGFFQYAAFGDEGVVLDSNSFIDSYDSAMGSYDSQVQGGNEWALENGDVGSNADIHLSSNTEVHGDCIPGPGHVVETANDNYFVSGSMEPADEPFELPPIDVPPIPSSGAIVGNTDVVLGPGEIHYDSILMNGGTKLTIVGPTKLVVDDFLIKSNTNLVFDTAGGPIELYATKDFELLSNSTVTTLSDSALGVTLLLAGDNMTKSPPDRIALSANSAFIGAIYAPNAEFSLASNFNIYGSIMCGFLDLSSFGEIHFDEALLYDGWGSSGEYEPALWRKVALD